MLFGKRKAAPVTVLQQRRLTTVTTPPNRTHRVDDEAGWQIEALGDLRISGFTSPEQSARLEQPWAGGPVDCAIDAATAKQRRIGSIDDGVDL
jgi:hypothetical protein